MEIEQQKARKILKALVYQDIIDEDNEENRGEKLNQEQQLIKEFTKFCGLSDDELDNLYEEVFENIDEFENNTFWENFVEKIAIVKREEEAEKKGIKFSQDEAFINLCSHEEEINKKLDKADLVNLWKYVAQHFK